VLKDINLTIERGEYVSIIGIPAAQSRPFSTSSPVSPNTRWAACCWKIAKSIRQDRIAPWCSRITACLPLAHVYENVRSRRQGVRSTKSRGERNAWTMHNLNLVQMGACEDKRPRNIRRMKQRVALPVALAMGEGVVAGRAFGALDALTRAHLQDSVMAAASKASATPF